ncbi:M23 family metallopeptidase [Hymenobacter sp. BRD67]|uniref:M23 family metallopeptidase n=1 Tax=Hymenobacter sp. BRD67 TaxID=2675877 RepID=UPI001563D293|nr:M23 family metallopeptidase [Hymenobacter sp. BRD67]QKG52597.1 M23 family metallopeptidase [Hymenobacter sp. BRD67]
MLFSFFPAPGRRQLGGFLGLMLALLASCSKPQTLAALFQKTTPHDDYARALDRAGLHEAALGRQWQQAAAQALRDSLVVPLPMLETGYFRPEQPTAASYRYAVRAGELVHVRLTLAAGPVLAPRLFVDAFALAPGHAPELLKWASADTTVAGTFDFSYQAADDGQHLLRVQPELLAAGRYTLRLWRGPGLGLFPVRGRTDQAIGSFWGSERDGGARRHEGVDIFAPRGTPAVAATDGTITRTGETPLGGRVVWLADAAHGQHLYYAHLDRQLVQPGQRVRAGDTLGLVGNTGNARTTAPHLHFGIYRAGGAIDPWPFLHRADPVPVAHTGPAGVGPDRRGEWVRPRPAQATRLLPATLPLLVLGQRADYLRVELPTGQRRYVAARAVAPAQPLRRLALPIAHEIQTAPLAGAPALAAWPSHTAAAVLGQSNGYALLRNAAGQQGWARL